MLRTKALAKNKRIRNNPIYQLQISKVLVLRGQLASKSQAEKYIVFQLTKQTYILIHISFNFKQIPMDNYRPFQVNPKLNKLYKNRGILNNNCLGTFKL